MKTYAHRGASGYAPENTLAAFEMACTMGAPAVETDVRLTRDGVAVLLHDARVDRTTDGQGAVMEMDWAQVASLDAGKWFGPQFAGQRVPRLDEFMAQFARRIGVCLEIKCAAAAGPTADLLDKLGAAAAPDVELTSFDWETVLAVHRRLPGRPAGLLTRNADTNEATLGRLVEHGIAIVAPPCAATSATLVARAHQLGLIVRTWGVNTREQLQHIIDCGADGTTLNWPDWHTLA